MVLLGFGHNKVLLEGRLLLLQVDEYVMHRDELGRCLLGNLSLGPDRRLVRAGRCRVLQRNEGINRVIWGSILSNIIRANALGLSKVMKVGVMVGHHLRLAHHRLRRCLSAHLRIMSINKVLKDNVIGLLSFEFFCLLGIYFLNRSKHVVPHVLVPVLLEYLARQLVSLELDHVDEVAEVAASASTGSMEVLAWHGPVISNFDLLLGPLLLQLQLFLLLDLRLDGQVFKVSSLGANQ